MDTRIAQNLLEVVLELEILHATKLLGFILSLLVRKELGDGMLLGKLIVKYLGSGHRKEAAIVFEKVSMPVVRKLETTIRKQFASIAHDEADGLLEQHEFNELVEVAFPRILTEIPTDVTRILERNLIRALSIEGRNKNKRRTEDFSWMWRPAIEDHQQNYDFGKIKEVLVTCLRDALLNMANKNLDDTLGPLLERYLKSGYSVFKRLALFVLSENADYFLDIITPFVHDLTNLNDYRIKHELFGLLKKAYPILDNQTKESIVSWIEQGPSTDWWIKWRKREEGKPPSDAALQKFVNHWQLERFWILREYLPEKADLIGQLEKDFGRPEHPDFPSWHESSFGDYESPLALSEFLQKSDSELVEILVNPPPDKENDPVFRYHGLGMVFESAIKEVPSRFLPLASLLAENSVLPVFIGHYFRGLREAWGLRKPDWKPQWTAELDELATLVAKIDPNPYQWSIKERSNMRLELSRFIEGIVTNQSLTPDEDQLHRLKDILLSMLGDSDPNESDELQDYSSNKDWPLISLNHASGEVLHSLIKYALCYARKHPVAGERLEGEVREAFLSVLRTENRPSVFSVFGTYLANLWYLDATWTQTNLELIFPRKSKLKFAASWDAYLKFNNVYKEVYDGLKHFYRLAIDAGTRRDPGEFDLTRLAQHLSLVYWQEWEDIKERESNVAHFFAKAPVSTRVNFIRQIWLGLKELKQSGQLTQQPSAWARAKDLWSLRVRKAQSIRGSKTQEDELSAFLDWLSACPEDVVTMKGLISKSLRKWNAKYHSGSVTEYLSTQSAEYPQLTVELLSDFFWRPWDQYLYYFDTKEVRIVLERAVNAGKRSATIAAAVASRLGEYGRFEYKDIWDRAHNAGKP